MLRHVGPSHLPKSKDMKSITAYTETEVVTVSSPKVSPWLSEQTHVYFEHQESEITIRSGSLSLTVSKHMRLKPIFVPHNDKKLDIFILKTSPVIARAN